jgi:signal transduction histidine kinase/ActR/RegA family two-component response regulator
MTRWLLDAPIRQKLIALGLIASTCAMIVASTVFLVATYVGARRSVRDAVLAQQAITTENISAALAFSDRAAASDTLRSLRSLSSIDLACAWDASGRFFAAYQPRLALPCPVSPPGALEAPRLTTFEVAGPVVVGGRGVGTLYLQANFSTVAAQLRAQVYATLAALLLGALAAIVIATIFQRTIARPITALAATAEHVSAHGDYSIRTQAASGDEVGHLVAAFNGMLAQIERRDEELRTANRLKDEFLATVSHELRTPLNAILGWLQILQMTPVSEERLAQALKSLDRNARAQARLVEDLLDVSRIVAGKLRLKMALVDLTQVLDEAIDVMRSAADAKGIRIVTQVAEPPHLVRGDPDRLQQAIWNLLANAVKFSETGAITVSLSHTAADTFVAVEDGGIGIDPMFLPHIFEPFRQGDASSTRKHPGLGLGLAIVREIAQAHGGSVEGFSDGIGHGARFVLRVPTAQQAVVATGQPTRLRPPIAVLRGVTALVVDDDHDARELAALALAERGAYVATAPDAAGAIDLIGTRDIDVLVADLAMPDVDGYGLLMQVHARELATGRIIPAVAVTAHTSIEDEARALSEGFKVFVRKPYRFDDLVDAVAEAARSVRGPNEGTRR